MIDLSGIQKMFITTLFTSPRTFAATALIVIFSICVHEFMHAFAALKMGDSTAADAGHLTMNPFRQMGLWSLIMLAFIGIAWGQVPVNEANLPGKMRKLTVFLAGVTANLFLALLFTIVCFFTVINIPGQQFAAQMLYFGAVINIVLLMINLLPIPGFDGWRVLTLFWKPHSSLSSEFLNGTLFIVMMIVFFGFSKIELAASSLIETLLNLLFTIAGK